MDLSTLSRIVNEFYAALKSKASEFPELFYGFPRGACGDSSRMLQRYLSERGIQAVYCYAASPIPSHAWLEIGTVIVDMTCCQFDDCPFACPYIGSDNSWHGKRVKIELDGEIGWDVWGLAYERVTESLMQSDRDG